MAQDRRLQFHERGTRVQAKLVGKPLPGGRESGERVDLAAAPVQREHELTAQALAERVGCYELVELGHQAVVPTQLQVSVDAGYQGRQPKLVQPGGLRLRVAGASEVLQHVATPQIQDRAEQLRGLLRFPEAEGLLAQSGEPLESGRVDQGPIQDET